MAGKADQLRARAARAANRTPAEQSEHPQHPDQTALLADQEAPAQPAPRRSTRRPAPTTPAPTVRTKPVRMTVDLSPLAHKQLKRDRDTLADQLGVPDLAGAVVVRALLAELARDPALAEAVRDRIATDPSGYGQQ